MSEQEQPRKKLSLGKKPLSIQRTSTLATNLKTKMQSKKEDGVKSFFKTADIGLSKLYEQRNNVLEQIKQLEHRLLFAKSEPLHEYLFELKTQDFELLAKISDKVTNL